MFAYGIDSRCYGRTCDCYCQLNTRNYRCSEMVEHRGFNLYQYVLKSKLLIYMAHLLRDVFKLSVLRFFQSDTG